MRGGACDSFVSVSPQGLAFRQVLFFWNCGFATGRLKITESGVPSLLALSPCGRGMRFFCSCFPPGACRTASPFFRSRGFATGRLKFTERGVPSPLALTPAKDSAMIIYRIMHIRTCRTAGPFPTMRQLWPHTAFPRRGSSFFCLIISHIFHQARLYTYCNRDYGLANFFDTVTPFSRCFDCPRQSLFQPKIVK